MKIEIKRIKNLIKEAYQGPNRRGSNWAERPTEMRQLAMKLEECADHIEALMNHAENDPDWRRGGMLLGEFINMDYSVSRAMIMLNRAINRINSFLQVPFPPV